MSGLERFVGALGGPDDDNRLWATGTVTQVYADGLVDVDLGRGAVTCQVLAAYTPRTGDVVAVLRQTVRDGAKPLVLGATRTENATTVDVQSQLAVVWDVAAAPAPGGASGTDAFDPVSTRSYRSSGGWSRAEVYQGVYASQFGVWTGCYFYGSQIRTALSGVRVTSASIRINRLNEGGVVAGVPTWLQRHAHDAQPGGSPIGIGARADAGAVGRGATATLPLPASWAQSLVDGTARGLMHADSSFAAYAIYASKATDAQTGRLSISWVKD